MIDERINDHLQRLNNYLIELREIEKKGKEDFINSRITIAATERIFQLAIESCLNIANRIISVEQFRRSIKPPETYAEIFLGLSKLNVVERDFAETLALMAKFRNRLTHLYWEVSPDELFKYLKNNLKDFDIFIKKIVEYLKTGK